MTDNSLVLLKQDIQPLATIIPQVFQQNTQSVEKCEDACAELLLKIEADGITDQYDQEASHLIEKSRKTIKKMLERRQPVTVVFDDIRGQFTALENAIDPKKEGTMPHRLQQIHNEYAAKLLRERQEKERKLQEEMEIKQATENYRKNVAECYETKFNAYLNEKLWALEKLFTEITLENAEQKTNNIKYYTMLIDRSYMESMKNTATILPVDSRISPHDQASIPSIIFDNLIGLYKDRFRHEICAKRDSLLEKINGKLQALQEAAQASADERVRLEKEMAERERIQREQEEAARLRKEEEQKARQQAEQQAKQAADLFATAAAAARPEAYAPKVKVSKKIQLTSPDGILPVIMMWWGHEGKDLSTDELQKIFKRQITFCEKIANKENNFIESPAVTYIDDVKAK